MEYSAIAHLFSDVPAAPKPIDDLRTLMERDGVSEEQLQQLVAAKGHYSADTPVSDYPDSFITSWCIRHWKQVVSTIKTMNNKEDKTHD